MDLKLFHCEKKKKKIKDVVFNVIFKVCIETDSYQTRFKRI